jgi:hypothetical protein
VTAPEGEHSRADGSGRFRLPVLYPTLLLLAFGLLLLFRSGAHPASAARLFVALAALSLGATALATVVLRNRDRAGLLSLLLSLLVLVGGDPRAAIALVVAIVAVSLYWSAMARRPRPILRAVTRVASALTVVAFLAVLVAGVGDGSIAELADDLGGSVGTPTARASAASTPDVVVVLLDGYARADTLASMGFDNGPFLADLQARGFEVLDESRSNYLITSLSLASMLNMRHLTDVAADARTRRGPDLVRFVRRQISDNRAFSAFHDAGFRTVSIASGFEEVSIRDVDRYVDTGQLNEFEILFLRTTGARALLEGPLAGLLSAQHRDRVRGVLGAVADVLDEAADRPRLVFAHVPSPHAPFVFGQPSDRSLDLRTYFEDAAAQRGMSRAEYEATYVAQLRVVSTLTIEALDRVLERRSRPTAVVLLSDHGSAAGMDWNDVEGSDLRERSANLLAFRSPGVSLDVADGMTLVNVFPTLLDAYAGVHLPRQPDTSYAWSGGYFDLVEIPSERLQ